MDESEPPDTLSDDELDKYGFVTSSPRRRAIVGSLRGDPAIPNEIADRTDIGLSHVSNVLRQLTEEEVAVCVNPDRKRGRVYRLTSTGERVAEKISEGQNSHE